MSNAICLATLDALQYHWHYQSLLPAPEPTADVVALAKRNGVSLPADFAALYQRANGMPLTDNRDFGEEGFYSPLVETLRAEPQELLVYSGRGLERVATTLTVFEGLF